MPKEKKEKKNVCNLCGGCDPSCVCMSSKKQEKNVEKTTKKSNNFKHLCFIH